MRKLPSFCKGGVAGLALIAVLSFFAACSNNSDSGANLLALGGAQSNNNNSGSNTNGTSDAGGSGGGNADTPGETMTDFPSGTTVWQGSVAFVLDAKGEWSGNFGLGISGVQEGDLILITHAGNSVPESYAWRVFEFQGYNWKGGYFTLGGKTVNAAKRIQDADSVRNIPARGNLVPNSSSQTSGFYLSASDAAIINSTGGITIYGCGYTVTKVVVVSSALVVSNNYKLKKDGWRLAMDFRTNTVLGSQERLHIEVIKDGSFTSSMDYYTNQSKHLEWSGVPSISGSNLSISTLIQEIRTQATSSSHNESFKDSDGQYVYVNLTSQNVGSLAATYDSQKKEITFTSIPAALGEYLETNTAYKVDNVASRASYVVTYNRVYRTSWTSTRNGVTKPITFLLDENNGNFHADFFIYGTYTFAGSTSDGGYGVGSNCTFDEQTRSGIITMANIFIGETDSITMPTADFAQGKTFNFVYAEDYSSVTLTSTTDASKTWTFVPN